MQPNSFLPLVNRSLFWSFVSSFLQDDDTTAMDEDIKVLHKADPAFQETLISEVIPDPMEGEQTWPTEEELREAGYLIICYYMAHVTPCEIVRSMIGSTSYPGSFLRSLLIGWDALTVGRHFPVWKFGKLCLIFRISQFPLLLFLFRCLNYWLLLLVCFGVFCSIARESRDAHLCHAIRILSKNAM